MALAPEYDMLRRRSAPQAPGKHPMQALADAIPDKLEQKPAAPPPEQHDEGKIAALDAAPGPRGQDDWKYDESKVAGMDKASYEKALGRPLDDAGWAKVQGASRPIAVTRSNGAGGWDSRMSGAYGDNGYAKGRALEIGNGGFTNKPLPQHVPAGAVQFGQHLTPQNYSGFEDDQQVYGQQPKPMMQAPQPMAPKGPTPPPWMPKPKPPTGVINPGLDSNGYTQGPNGIIETGGYTDPAPQLAAMDQAGAKAMKPFQGPGPAPSSLGLPPAPKSNYTAVTDPGNFDEYQEPQQPSFGSALAKAKSGSGNF